MCSDKYERPSILLWLNFLLRAVSLVTWIANFTSERFLCSANRDDCRAPLEGLRCGSVSLLGEEGGGEVGTSGDDAVAGEERGEDGFVIPLNEFPSKT